MSKRIAKKCPECTYTLEKPKWRYNAIGIPFKECPQCGEVVKFDHIFEWDTKKFFGKLGYVGIIVNAIILYGIGFSGLYALIIEFIGIDSNIIFFSGISLIFIGLIIKYVFQLYQQIQESRKRFEDPKYREMLKKMGFDIY